MIKKSYWLPIFRKFIPADLESWIESLASEGWNIDKLGMFSVFRLTFQKTGPKRYRYVFDMNLSASYRHKEYRQIYEQFGWEYVGRFNANSYLWRKEYTDERPESFTDMESLKNRNKRVRNAVLAAFILMLISIFALTAGIIICALVGKTEKILPLACVIVFVIPLSVYLYWVIRKMNASLGE